MEDTGTDLNEGVEKVEIETADLEEENLEEVAGGGWASQTVTWGEVG